MNHSDTYLLPLIIVPAFLVYLYFRRTGTGKVRSYSVILYLLTMIATTFSCGLGGSIMRKTGELSGVNLTGLKIHAWLGGITFLSSLVLLILVKGKEKRHTSRLIYALTFLFVLCYALSILYSSNIFTTV